MAKKSPLGRGLGALISDGKYEKKTVEEAVSTGAVAEIDINKITENPFQPRKEFEPEALKELSDSIKQLGIIQPITVVKLEGDKFQLIAGERRLRASKLAGLKKITAFIRKGNDEEILEMAIVENIQREDLNALEIALSYKRLIDECGITQDQVGKKVGKKRSTVTNYISLLKLSPEIQAGIISKSISFGHARALSKIEDPKIATYIFNNIIENKLSVRETEVIIKNLKDPTPSVNKIKKTKLPENYEQFKQKIKKHFPAKVDIKRNNLGKGNLLITFRSDKEFEEIMTTLNKIDN